MVFSQVGTLSDDLHTPVSRQRHHAIPGFRTGIQGEVSTTATCSSKITTDNNGLTKIRLTVNLSIRGPHAFH